MQINHLDQSRVITLRGQGQDLQLRVPRCTEPLMLLDCTWEEYAQNNAGSTAQVVRGTPEIPAMMEWLNRLAWVRVVMDNL